MSVSSKSSIDASYLSFHGYTFGEKLSDSLYRVKLPYKNMVCKIIKHKNDKSDDRLEMIGPLSHPNIVPVHSVLKNSKNSYVFMQWAKEGNLLSFIKANGALEESKANFWFYQLVCAVKYLHSLDLAHCNLRCDSVLISKDTVKVSGLGHIQRSSNVSLVSTPSFYRPPNANKKNPSVNKSIDVFALGVILFMMVNGAVPFVSGDLSQLIDDQLNQRFAIRASKIHSLSLDCQTMIHVLLEPNDETRWSIEKVFKMRWLSKFVQKHGDC